MAFSESLIAFNETLLVIKPVSSEIRDILLSWIEILIFFLIIILIFSAVVYVLVSLINDTDQLVIMPFITGSKEDKYDGNAISAALIFELNKLSKSRSDKNKAKDIASHFTEAFCQRLGAYSFLISEEIPKEKMDLFLRMNTNLTGVIGDAGTLSAGGITVPTQFLLSIFRKISLLRGNVKIIDGYLHRYDNLITMTAVMEKPSPHMWEVVKKINNDKEIPSLIRDLAFKITADLSPELCAENWQSLRSFTDALDNYDQYRQTKKMDYLNVACDHCLMAYQFQKNYEPLLGLSYRLGLALLNEGKLLRDNCIFEEAKSKFLKSKTMFDEAEQLSNAVEIVFRPFNPSYELFKPFTEYVIPYDLAVEYLMSTNKENEEIFEKIKKISILHIYYYRSIAMFHLFRDYEAVKDLAQANNIAISIPNVTVNVLSWAKEEIGRDVPPLPNAIRIVRPN